MRDDSSARPELTDVIIGMIRTTVGSAMGAVLAWVTVRNISLEAGVPMQLVVALVASCSAVYYAIVALLERDVHPGFGWLLGFPKSPRFVSREVTQVVPDPGVQVGVRDGSG